MPRPSPIVSMAPEMTILVHGLGDHLLLEFGVAAVSVPADFSPRYRASSLASGGQVPTWAQEAFIAYFSEGKFDAHIERCRSKYLERRLGPASMMSKFQSLQLKWKAPSVGHRVWALLLPGTS